MVTFDFFDPEGATVVVVVVDVVVVTAATSDCPCGALGGEVKVNSTVDT